MKEKKTITRKIWIFVIPAYLNIESSFLFINFIKNNNVEIKKINGNISKIIDGVFNNDKKTGKKPLTSSFCKKLISSNIFIINIKEKKINIISTKVFEYKLKIYL